MVESRWLRWIGPGVIALGAVGLIASTTVGAGPRAWTPRPCPGTPADRVAGARDVAPITPADLAAAPWFRLDPVAAADGSLRGQRLVLGRFGDPLTRALDLPAESFAAGPFGHIVLAGSDDGSTSRLEMVDVAGGCSWTLGSERDVIRRATIDPSGSVIYEMRVDRATRADLGIWRRPVDAASTAERILDPIAPDARFGRTFSTEFCLGPGRRAARGPVLRRVRLSDEAHRPCHRHRQAARSARSRPPGRRRRGLGGDLRGLPGPSLPHRLDRHRDRCATRRGRCRRTGDPRPIRRRTPARPREVRRGTDRDPVRPTRRIRPVRRRVDRSRRPSDRDASLDRVRCPDPRRMGAPRAGRSPPDRPE